MVEGGAEGEELQYQIQNEGVEADPNGWIKYTTNVEITKNNQNLYVRLSDGENESTMATYNESKVDPIDPDLRIGDVDTTTDSIIIPIISNKIFLQKYQYF